MLYKGWTPHMAVHACSTWTTPSNAQSQVIELLHRAAGELNDAQEQFLREHAAELMQLGGIPSSLSSPWVRSTGMKQPGQANRCMQCPACPHFTWLTSDARVCHAPACACSPMPLTTCPGRGQAVQAATARLAQMNTPCHVRL